MKVSYLITVLKLTQLTVEIEIGYSFTPLILHYINVSILFSSYWYIDFSFISVAIHALMYILILFIIFKPENQIIICNNNSQIFVAYLVKYWLFVTLTVKIPIYQANGI